MCDCPASGAGSVPEAGDGQAESREGALAVCGGSKGIRLHGGKPRAMARWQWDLLWDRGDSKRGLPFGF
ncbi:hypothetical protein Nmel_006318 [Mimus melanotis]